MLLALCLTVPLTGCQLAREEEAASRDRLVGALVNATVLRAGAAMVIAGLMGEGVTEIGGIEYILRGYEHIDQKLMRLGARIERIQSESSF